MEVGKLGSGDGHALAFASIKTYAQSCEAFNFPPSEVNLRVLSILGSDGCPGSSVGMTLPILDFFRTKQHVWLLRNICSMQHCKS